MDEMDNMIALTDESGNESRFELLDLLEYCGDEYIVLLPVEEASDEPEMVVILKVEENEDSDDENYVGVEDEDVLSAVFDLFKQKYQDEFDFVD